MDERTREVAIMRLVMAVSKDGYIARGPEDDMSWLGATDKAVFRILTGVGHRQMAVGRRSAKSMPFKLEGRVLNVLSGRSDGKKLDEFYAKYPDAWLLGGQTLALIALEAGYVDEVHLCRSDRMAFPESHWSTQVYKDRLTPWLQQDRQWSETWLRDITTKVLDVTVERWRND